MSKGGRLALALGLVAVLDAFEGRACGLGWESARRRFREGSGISSSSSATAISSSISDSSSSSSSSSVGLAFAFPFRFAFALSFASGAVVLACFPFRFPFFGSGVGLGVSASSGGLFFNTAFFFDADSAGIFFFCTPAAFLGALMVLGPGLALAFVLASGVAILRFRSSLILVNGVLACKQSWVWN